MVTENESDFGEMEECWGPFSAWCSLVGAAKMNKVLHVISGLSAKGKVPRYVWVMGVRWYVKLSSGIYRILLDGKQDQK